MGNDDYELSINPLLQKLAEAGEQGTLVVLEGYIGPTDDNDKLRLYKRLDLTEYIEISKDAVLHAVEPDEPLAGMTRVYVTNSTAVKAVNISVGRVDNIASKTSEKKEICDTLDDMIFEIETVINEILYGEREVQTDILNLLLEYKTRLKIFRLRVCRF